MKTISQANAFKGELDRVINTFIHEWDLTVAEVLGVLSLIDFELKCVMRDNANKEKGNDWKT